jgi:AraC-like DNA-binding protein/mannose-6-phosphate isomerase-like protein (cupin superfamily)
MQNNGKIIQLFTNILSNICTVLIFSNLIPLERILPDPESSFKVLYHHVMPDVFLWNYHYHPEIELVFVFDGIGRRHVGNHVSYYENGDLVLIGSNLPHSGFGYGALGKHEELVIQFKRELVQEIAEFEEVTQLLRKAQYGISFSEEVKKRLESDFREIKSLAPFEKYLCLLSILKKLALEADYQILNNTQYQKSDFAKDQNRILRIFQYVEKNYSNDIATQEVADLSSLTLPAFCNYFKKNLGVSFTDFLNEYRINQACIQLTEGQSVSNVAFLCGFNSLSYFSRTFKYFKNISPSEFQSKVFEKKERR